LDERLSAASNAMIVKPKINPRNMPPINIAKAMAVTPCFFPSMGRGVQTTRKIKLVKRQPPAFLVAYNVIINSPRVNWPKYLNPDR
jgi:hypothetical protein